MTGEELKRRRTAQGVTQVMLAAYLGVHEMTLSKWERGINPIPHHIEIAIEHWEQLIAYGRTGEE